MLKRLGALFGVAARPPSPYEEFEPVYGFPRREVEEWLARNPRLREEYAVQEWLARNPPLWAEYEAAQREKWR